MKKDITQAEIQQAMAAFRKQGGLVRHLPEQKTVRRRGVGGRHSGFEDPRRDFLGIF